VDTGPRKRQDQSTGEDRSTQRTRRLAPRRGNLAPLPGPDHRLHQPKSVTQSAVEICPSLGRTHRYGAPGNDCAIVAIREIQKAYGLRPDSRDTIIKYLGLPADQFEDGPGRYKGLQDPYQNRSTTELLNAALNPRGIYVDQVPQDFDFATLVGKGDPLLLGGRISTSHGLDEPHMVAGIPGVDGKITINNIAGKGGSSTYTPAQAIAAGFPLTVGTPPASSQMWHTYQKE